MSSRKSFKVIVDGKVRTPPKDGMFVMNSQGVFFLVILTPYYPSVTKLSTWLGTPYTIEFKE